MVGDNTMSENWYKPDCEKCEHFMFTSPFGFIESKECLLSPLEKCSYENELSYNDRGDEDDCSEKVKTG